MGKERTRVLGAQLALRLYCSFRGAHRAWGLRAITGSPLLVVSCLLALWRRFLQTGPLLPHAQTQQSSDRRGKLKHFLLNPDPRRERGGKEREMRETSVSCLPHLPRRGIRPTTSWCRVSDPANGATQAGLKVLTYCSAPPASRLRSAPPACLHGHDCQVTPFRHKPARPPHFSPDMLCSVFACTIIDLVI